MFILVDKEKGITSHDVIDIVRRATGVRKVGHAGTLDPNATGLLIVGVGRDSTKKLGNLTQNTDKEYIADVMLGEERDTDDVEGKIRNTRPVSLNKSEITKDKLQKVLSDFVGSQEQIPPQYSAIKNRGKKAYEMARQGKDVTMKSRKIVIHSIKLLKYDYPLLKIECSVSSGTYIRALARDIGRKLGTYAYLNNLRRTKIGEYRVDDAVRSDKITKEVIDKSYFDIVD